MMEDIVTGVELRLRTVTVAGPVTVVLTPTGWLPKAMEVGVDHVNGNVAVPEIFARNA